ncbi:MAG: prepilin-type N-terminal cleavage/methylation domain-containing protein [Kiritimatiellales bacterium]|nr:prepilin-type N-terminal cleavage/methylation domain-containing protein [Pontiella sp.]NNJ70944.1 prepilin-type N-terminal cleavage/methylation domain-containing protein [Kiritimatiellales bacterium]
MKTKKQNKSGFTLVELMVVAIIVAILAAVAIPLMTGNKERAAATEAQAGCSTIATAMRMLRAEQGSYDASSVANDIQQLPGMRSGDLDGTYFSDGSYVLASSPSNFTITATANGPKAGEVGISGKTLSMEVKTTGEAEWGGTLTQ